MKLQQGKVDNKDDDWVNYMLLKDACSLEEKL